MSILKDFHVHSYSMFEFPAAARVLDVGCGPGEQLAELIRRGYEAVGIDPEIDSVEAARRLGVDVRHGVAEKLPYQDASFDGVVCKVVLPYTRSAEAMAEIARVLKPGGIGRFCFHGAGYYLLYLFRYPNWKQRFYGARSLASTWAYATTGFRLPGFLGDTIYQSRTRLARYYRRYGLQLIEDIVAPEFAGCPVFIYQTVRKSGGPGEPQALAGATGATVYSEVQRSSSVAAINR